jgi:hypothetical protein
MQGQFDIVLGRVAQHGHATPRHATPRHATPRHATAGPYNVVICLLHETAPKCLCQLALVLEQ